MSLARVSADQSSAGAPTRPPFVYYGGKSRLAGRIAALLPEHAHYVEPFAGSLAVLLAKPASKLETVNDLDGDLMLFWRVLRDRPEELARVCALTPHSRTERELAGSRPADLPELERARRIWVCLTQGRTGTLRSNTGWRFDCADSAHTSMPGRLNGYVERLDTVATRLMSVSLECRPALDVITAYGGKRRTLLYVDPPYLSSVRERNYRHEMGGQAQHRELAAVLHACTATVVISGYASDLYDLDLYPDWYRHELPASTSQGGTWEHRTEVLWSNRPLHHAAAGPSNSDLLDLAEFRNATPRETSECNETRCAAADCAKVIRQPATGRPRTYCCTACRVRAHRQALSAKSPTSVIIGAQPRRPRTPGGVRVRVVGDLFHGRLPEPTRPGGLVRYVGRGAPGLPASRYANRHRVGACRVCRHEHDQVDAVVAYASDLAGQLELVDAARRELAGDLACWCRSGPCHADVLLAVVAGADPARLANRAAILALAESVTW